MSSRPRLVSCFVLLTAFMVLTDARPLLADGSLSVDDSLSAESENTETIRKAAEAYVMARLDTGSYGSITVQAKSLDSRLKLAHCDQALETFSNSSTVKAGRTTVGVRCRGQKPWTLYVPVNVTATVTALEVASNLTRGAVPRPEDFRIVEKSMNQLPNQYIQDIDAIDGMELSRAVTIGTILTLNMLKERLVIQKGQEVIILASGSNFEVRMQGTALENGKSGELISVRNDNSGRTVEAKIINASSVEVKL